EPVRKVLGEIIYAGGRQTEGALEVEVVKAVSQSYLTRLWNNESIKPAVRNFRSFSDRVSRYFTPALVGIAAAAFFFWWAGGDWARAWGAFTAVLIIACPCALALSSPFTLSAAMSLFDKNRFYVKNTAAIEQMARIDSLVFDKTGTISSPSAARMRWEGNLLPEELAILVAVCKNSHHPLSRELVNWAGDIPSDGYAVTN